MASEQAYTVEDLPGRRRLPWRFPALMILLLTAAAGYWFSRPYCQVAGHYKGRIGNDYSMEKYQLRMSLSQQGRQLSGQCEVSHQTRNQVIAHQGKLWGEVRAETFRLRGVLDDGRTIHFEGSPRSTSEGRLLAGETWTLTGNASQRVAFRVEYLDGRTSPQDLLPKRAKKARP